jgi:hypothetical protein
MSPHTVGPLIDHDEAIGVHKQRRRYAPLPGMAQVDEPTPACASMLPSRPNSMPSLPPVLSSAHASSGPTGGINLMSEVRAGVQALSE